MNNLLWQEGLTQSFKMTIEKYLESKKIKDIFTKSRDNLLGMDLNDDELGQQIKLLFSEESLQKLVNECSNLSGYDIVDFVERELKGYFNNYDFNETEIEFFIKSFINDLKENIKSIKPNMYMEIFLAEQKEELNAKLEEIKESIRLLKSDDNELTLETIFDVEKKLVDSSKYNINLSFFDYGEKDIDLGIIKEFEDKRIIYVKGRSREEVLYYTLRLLKQNNIYNVFVVNSYEDWKQVDKYSKDNILIPFFYHRNIEVALNNKVIFILGEEDFEGKNTVVRIPNRIKRNLYDTLNIFIEDPDKVHKIVEETMGIYPALKRELFEGLPGKPKWTESDKKFLIKVLLIGEWTNREGDCTFIRQFTGLEFDEFIFRVNEISSLEDPLIIEYNVWNGKKYKLVDPFNAWSLLKSFVRKDDMKLFHKLMIDVIMDDKAIKEINDCFSNNGIYSDSLKKGILKSLIYINIVFSNEVNSVKCIAKDIVEDICKKVNSKEEWMYICQFLPILIEANVDIVFSKLEESIVNNDDEFWAMYMQQGDGLTSRNYYVNILHSLEKMVFIKGYLPIVVDILGFLADKNIKYNISNTPEDILARIFCAWYQEIPLKAEAKVRLLEKFCRRHYSSGVELIKKLLVHYGAMYCPLCKPDYIFYDVAVDLLPQEIIMTKEKYFEIMLGLFDNDLTLWKSLFEGKISIKQDTLEILEDKLLLLVKDIQIEDKRKYEFSQCLRGYIHLYRLHNNITDKERFYLERLENIFNAITYNDAIYCKLYAFEEGDIKSLNPGDFEKEYDFHKLNEHKNNEQQRILREDFIEGNVSLYNLIEKCADTRETGHNIAVCLNEVDIYLMEVMYANKKYRALQGYVNEMFTHKEIQVFKDFFEKALSPKTEPDFRGLILLAMELNASVVALAELDSNVEKYYWENNYLYTKFTNHVFAGVCMVKALQYNNFRLAFLWTKINEYPLDVYLSILIKYLQYSDKKLNNVIDAYTIRSVFKKIYAFENLDDDTKETIILLEKSYVNAFDNGTKPLFLYQRLIENPEFVAGLLMTIYREEGTTNNESISDEEQNIATVNHNVLANVKFCPTCYDEMIDESKLDSWCKQFLEVMTDNNREKIAFIFLGEWFANSPKIENENWPLPQICNVIEKYYNDELRRGFILQIHNSRGVHWCNHGVEEKELSDYYTSCADLIQLDYPKTAKILREISEEYFKESVLEREKAMYEY